MKKIINKSAHLLIIALAHLLINTSIFAQAPQKMSYQAVIRNSNDSLLISTPVGMRISLLQSSPTGTVVFSEIQTATTNANGLVSLQIGMGTAVSGTFAGIDWAAGPYYVKTETDLSGGTNYTITSSNEILSVPYALFSANGTPGPAGPIGLTGETGAQGPTGNGFSNGTAVNQLLYWNGSAWVTLNPGIDGQVLSICNGSLTWSTMAGACPAAQPQFPEGTVNCAAGATTVVDVTNPTTGKIWMDRNLGATQVANSSTDVNSYGDLYQWGRRADGHQCRTSPTTATLSSIDQPAHGDIIIAPNAPYDWRSPQNANLWQGVNGVNNPCPSGYRIPTETELDAERLSWSINTSAGAFASPLKLPMAGYRAYSGGSITNVGTYGNCWSSSVSGTSSRDLNVYSSNALMDVDFRTYCFSVRCIKDASAIPATLGAINCGSTSITGTLTSGIAASGVSTSVPYTGGNGGSYAAQTISSTGVTGLTATLSLGILANGAGSLTYTISGTPTTSGTASFSITVGGQSCSFTVSVGVAIGQYPEGTVHCAGATTVVDVTNPTTGRIWMDRNLGATQVATSSTDANSYGDLYQWGRRADGHQCRTSPTTATLSSIDQPAHGDFILAPNAPSDWRSPQNVNLWQGVNGVNNPCPTGYRIPTETEINSERLSWSQNNSAGAFASPLKLPMAGHRDNSNGSLYTVGTYGYYWSSTVSGTSSLRLHFSSSNAVMDDNDRTYGFSVRCIKD